MAAGSALFHSAIDDGRRLRGLTARKSFSFPFCRIKPIKSTPHADSQKLAPVKRKKTNRKKKPRFKNVVPGKDAREEFRNDDATDANYARSIQVKIADLNARAMESEREKEN